MRRGWVRVVDVLGFVLLERAGGFLVRVYFILKFLRICDGGFFFFVRW